jgi:hydrogenase nickel incorporation protein HypA/HybF
MHEMGLMQTCLELACDQARLHGARRIEGITLRVGDLSGAVPEALELAFEVVSPGTVAEGARFLVERVAVICRCAACASDFYPSDVVFECPSCGRLSAEVRQGRELELTNLEVS